MPENLALATSRAWPGLRPRSRRRSHGAEAAPEGSDEARHAACALIPLRHAVRAAEVEVVLARGPTSAYGARTSRYCSIIADGVGSIDLSTLALSFQHHASDDASAGIL